MDREQPFNLDNWLSSSVFPDARCVRRGRASSQVSEIGLAGTSKRQHQGTQYLLNGVQRFKAFVVHICSLFKKFRV